MSTSANKIYLSILKTLEKHGVEPSQMFGKPCLKIGKKAFAVLFQDEMVFKIGKEGVKSELERYEGSKRFDPSRKGRSMKEWIQIPTIYSDDWETLAKEAMHFVEKLK